MRPPTHWEVASDLYHDSYRRAMSSGSGFSSSGRLRTTAAVAMADGKKARRQGRKSSSCAWSVWGKDACGLKGQTVWESKTIRPH